MNTKLENTNLILSSIGTCIGIQDIQNVLGIFVTIINVIIGVISLFVIIKKAVKGADKNGDGKISKDEAKDAYNEHKEEIDTAFDVIKDNVEKLKDQYKK